MSYSDKIEKRQVVNFAMTAPGPVSIGINLQFQPDVVVLRQFAFSTSAVASNNTFQVVTDLIQDQVLCMLPSVSFSATPQTHFFVQQNWNGGMVTIQVQDIPIAPATGTGNGPLSVVTTGELGLILEFIKYVR